MTSVQNLYLAVPCFWKQQKICWKKKYFQNKVSCVTMVFFFSYKKSKLQTKLCVQTGYSMFSILVVYIWYFYRQNKTHQLYCKYWTPSVHIIQTLIFLFVYFWPTASHFYAYRSHRWNIHKVEKEKVSRLVTKPDMHAIIFCATQIVFCHLKCTKRISYLLTKYNHLY